MMIIKSLQPNRIWTVIFFNVDVPRHVKSLSTSLVLLFAKTSFFRYYVRSKFLVLTHIPITNNKGDT